jgi:SRSO17 transposase
LLASEKSRICELAHQQVKEELDLDHFEGRSWQVRHRHALMAMIAYAFLQHRPLAQAGPGKKHQRAGTSAKSARSPPRHRRSHAVGRALAMSSLPPMVGNQML